MRYWIFFLFATLLAACTSYNTGESKPKTETLKSLVEPSDLPDLGEAPELVNEVWLNTPEPLRLADLQGQVVLLEMWTFG